MSDSPTSKEEVAIDVATELRVLAEFAQDCRAPREIRAVQLLGTEIARLYAKLRTAHGPLSPFVCAVCHIPASFDPLAGQFAHNRGSPHDHHPVRAADEPSAAQLDAEAARWFERYTTTKGELDSLRAAQPPTGLLEAAQAVVTAVRRTQDHTEWFKSLAALMRVVEAPETKPAECPHGMGLSLSCPNCKADETSARCGPDCKAGCITFDADIDPNGGCVHCGHLRKCHR